MTKLPSVLTGIVLSSLLAGMGALFPIPAHARSEDINVCDQAAERVAGETGVPLSILKAISRTETGRERNGRFEPWPWAINAAGKGLWLASKSAAVNEARKRLSGTSQNVDIGCFQLNYRWHGGEFSTLEEMFDPVTNARYAAEFLQRLHDEKGDWMRAVGAYHSRTPKHAVRYKRRFSEIHARLGPETKGVRPTQSVAQKQSNQFPLLRRSAAQPRLGSLVPLGQETSRGGLFRQTGGI